MFENLGNISAILSLVVPIILFVTVMAMGYVKAPPDKAIVISGLRKKPKILTGRAGIKIPFLERSDVLLLRQVTIDVKTGEYIPTLDFINIQVDAVVKVRVSTDEEKMELAMKNFLNKNSQDIVVDLQDSLQGNMREIIGTISLKDICNNRDAFGNQVQSKAMVDMEKLGIEIISCNIQNVVAKNGLIDDMGMDNTAKIKKDASIAKAEADKEVAIAQARANKEANDARVISETEISERDNELAIKRAELKKEADIKQAEADSAYEIQKQEQRKTIGVAESNADIAKQERQVELKTKEASVKEQELSATIKKQADAEKYAAEKGADVELYKRQKDAEAKRYEQEQEAEGLKKKAEAEKYAKEQEAIGIKAVGEAEATAIKAKALAEAEGIDKKADAMKKMGDAAVLEMFFEAYPKVMEAAAKPLANVDQIMMFGEGNSAKMVGDIVSSTKQVLEGIKGSTGVDVQALIAGFLGGKLNDKFNPENEKEVEKIKEESK